MASWLDLEHVRRLCLAFAGAHALVAIANLAFIPSEHRAHVAWQTHIEAPVTNRAPSPGLFQSEEGPLNLRIETLRLARQQLDLDRECNLSTWMASVQAGMVAFTALLLWLQSGRRPWLLVALGCLALSADELCQFHEWIGAVVARSGFHLGPMGPPYPWVIVLGPVLLAYAGGVLWFLNRELSPHPRLRRIVVLGLLLMAAALPLEVIGGWIQGDAPRPPRLEVIAEETAEALGGTSLLYTLLALLALRMGRGGTGPEG